MTKTIFITLEDKEHERLKKLKGSLTWEEALLRGAEAQKGEPR